MNTTPQPRTPPLEESSHKDGDAIVLRDFSTSDNSEDDEFCNTATKTTKRTQLIMPLMLLLLGALVLILCLTGILWLALHGPCSRTRYAYHSSPNLYGKSSRFASYLRRIDPFRLGVSPVASSFRRSDPCTEFDRSLPQFHVARPNPRFSFSSTIIQAPCYTCNFHFRRNDSNVCFLSVRIPWSDRREQCGGGRHSL
jgi:hypothetical protein